MTRRRIALLAGLLGLFGMVLLVVATRWGPVLRLDHRVADSLYRHGRHHPGELRFWRDVSLVLHPDVLRVAAAAAAILLWSLRRVGDAIFVVVAMGGQAVLETGVKLAVNRDRPSFTPALAHAGGASFPSGHAMTSFVAFGLLVLLVSPRARVIVGAPAGAAVVLVAFSRLALTVHYASDVAGAWLLGAAWLVLADWLTGGFRGARRVPDPPPGR